MTIQLTHHVPLRRAGLRVELARLLPSVILGGYGIFILSLFARQVMIMYINPTYVWPTTAAGVVLVVLGIVAAYRRSAAACDSDSCACEDPPKALWRYAFLSIPLLLAVLFPPRGLEAFSATQRGAQIAGFTAIHAAASVRRVSLSVDTSTFSLQDWVGALSVDPNPKDYLGKPINLSGLVIHNPGSVPPGFIMVLRYQITCCIADAQPEGLIVRDISHGTLKDNQWVTVHGTMGEASYQGQKLAVVDPKQILLTKPGNPYMY